MHQSLIDLKQRLESVIATLRSAIPNDEPLGNAHGSWNLPGITRAELIAEAQSMIDSIDNEGSDDVGEHGPHLTDYVRRLQHLESHTIPQMWGGNGGAAVAAYVITMNGLRKALEPVLTRDSHREAIVNVRKLLVQVRGMESSLKGLQPRYEQITHKIEVIERGYDAADRLPTDLQSLEEAKQKVADALQDATQNQGRLLAIRERSDDIETRLEESVVKADAVLKNAETAYRAATSVGLAAAFTERSKKLAFSMWIWVGGLAAALLAGGFFGTHRLQALAELFKEPNQPASVIYPNVLLSLLSVGAPIWFAWLSTKQIGQRFRLSEDYAFKASISRAYEGYRSEAARIDPELERRLLASALTRLDELPLRLVETETHGSPWNELANSNLVKEAIKTVPDFTGQVRGLAERAIASVKPGQTSKPTPIEDAKPPTP